MKLRLKPVHLLLGILAVLLLSSLGYGVREYFEGSSEQASVEAPAQKAGEPNVDTIQGIPRSEIPEGDEDLYILKSQVVPPVCPKCPDVQACAQDKKCPACPPCGRCPEPAFTCKKVPNYAAAQTSDIIPRPVLSDFSQFGM